MTHLYLIQNDTHMKNFKTLMCENDKYIDLGQFTGQILPDKKSLIGQEIFLPIQKINFFQLSAINRLRFILKNKKTIKKALLNFNFERIIIGNDGAIQKLIIECLPNKQNTHIDMWLDGLISLNTSKILNTIKIINSRLFDYLNLAFIVPSVIGFYKRIEILYVMHSSILNEYKNFSSLIKLSKIKLVTFPRHHELLKKANTTIHSDRTIVLYLTSAWEFHGKKIEQEKQRVQIMNLINSFNNNKNISFRVRVHPRDTDEIYLGKHISKWLSTTPNFEDDIINSHIVISARSTGLLEASMINKKAIIYNEGFGDKYLNEYTNTLDKYDSIYEILEIIKKKKSND